MTLLQRKNFAGPRRGARGWAVRASVCVSLWLLALLGVEATASAADPYLEWFTVTTPHFRVHFHSGLDEFAERAAAVAERAHHEIAPQLGWEPSQVTDIVIADDSDSANGFAYTLPSNTIRLYVTAPEDMSALNDYDDWQVELISHEYTHILHIDNTSGVPALVNAILGKTSAPNQLQPRWVLEGLAVAMESAHTSAGRLRSALFDMYLRTDVLGSNLASLDEISQSPRRWPGGDLWYLYGSKFIEWILFTYGPDTYSRVANEYGKFLIPWGINRVIRRATGRTYPELYAGWKATLEARYAAQASAIRARGLREGVRLTTGGRAAFSPRFVPPACTDSNTPELIYYRDDGEQRAGIYRVPARPNGDAERTLLSRSSGGNASIAPDCSLYFDSVAPSRRKYFFNDLFRLPRNVQSESGVDLRRERLTTGVRAREPDVSPDGRSIAFVTNAKGTSTLRLADLDAAGHLGRTRRLVPSASFEQAYTPRFSPDGKRIAYSAWSRGGYRDIRVVDVQTGAFFELMHDRALDQQPAWSPDGQTLYFVSDRGGVANIYAYDFRSARIAQVTNVISGAYMPAPSPDGRSLAYVGYTTAGFDLFLMPLEPTRFLEPLPPPERPDGVVSVAPERFPVSRYNPLATVRPRAYEVSYGTGSFGKALTLKTRGSDAVGHHGYEVSTTFEGAGPEWQGYATYSYGRLPFDFQASAYRFATPQSGYRVGEQQETVVQHQYGLSTAVGLWDPGEFDAQNVGLSFNLATTGHDSPLGTRVDPWAPVPSEPRSGLFAWTHLGYGYTNAESSTYAISNERGLSLSLGMDFADPAFGSDWTLASFYGSVTGYLRAPWAKHHVLALAASGGGSSGSYAQRQVFTTGGYADQPILDVYTSGIRQSLFVLRGFAPRQFAGNNYTLFNAEYRFPIAYIDRGVSTLPWFVRQVSGALFSDWGGAYNKIDHNDPLSVLHLGVGGELWLALYLGYRMDFTLRVGLAHGFGDAAPSSMQSYFVITSAF